MKELFPAYIRLRESAVGVSRWCDVGLSLIPEQSGRNFSKLLRLAPLSWQRACWSS
ncbi:MAG: hypothetical protein J6D52_00535 [Clostridia bacterium]|nr:hypothetical protein [Clostridia bacterium]